ncbi:MAG TPA: hypothetical protein VGS07_29070 [Thermoanaerobaculia bacterium]|jgi:hypothetical protein|nr:hypothetical protein [Thermoanaerobaculia bacterium]
MKKKMNDKLALHKETLRTLTGLDLAGALGAATTRTTGASNITDTCDTCFGPSCHDNTNTNTFGSACC